MGMSAEDRAKLIALARSAIKARVTGWARAKSDVPCDADADNGESRSETSVLSEKRGCFVTLTNAGRLRGCIGTFHPRRTLAETIVEMGAAAAADPRFVGNPITAAELGRLTVEISVLSPLAETDDPAGLEIGRDGIYVVRGAQSGCFLPEVATDMGWDAEEFLTECCVGKAGLPADAWRQPDATVYLFTSEKFDR